MKYRTNVRLNDSNSSHSIIARQITTSLPNGGRILDLGCAAGDLGGLLTEQGFEVTDIDRDSELLSLAHDRLANTLKADFESESWVQALQDLSGNEMFDAVVLSNILEHVTEPASLLSKAKNFLAPNGLLLVSVSNVAHGALRLSLLQGRWKYTDEGLLDATHLRFFTLNSAVDLIQSTGLNISKLHATSVEVLETEIPLDDAALPSSFIEWVRDQDGASDYQYVFTCQPSSTPSETLPPVIRETAVRPYDKHAKRTRVAAHRELVTERLERMLDATTQQRYDELTLRDEIIGLQAQIANLKKQLNDQEVEAMSLNHQLSVAHSRLNRTVEGMAYRTVRKAARVLKRSN